MEALSNVSKADSPDGLDSLDYPGALDNLRVVGPLTLDSSGMRGYIVTDAALQFSPGEFELLYALAMREDIPLTFERLYASFWEREDGVCRREEARRAISKVARQVNAAGNGFVWIEYNPSSGYTFRTKWGHNREKWQQPTCG